MKAEILKGMDVLDQERPGWENKIDLNKLDQFKDQWTTDGCGCVLVQVFGRYIDGLYQLRIDGNDADLFGFNIDDVCSASEDNRPNYKTLTLWWKRLFRARYGSTNPRRNHA